VRGDGQEDRALAWLEDQPTELRPECAAQWAAHVLEKRPDLADRLLKFVRWAVDEAQAASEPE